MLPKHFLISLHPCELTLTVIFSCGRLQIAYNQRAYTKCYPNIFLSVYIHVNTKTAFSFFQYLHTTVIFSCGRLQIAYNQRAYTKCYPNIFLSVYIHVNTKTAFSFFQYLHTSLFVFAYPQQPRLLLFVYKFQILLQKQSYSFHDS